MESKTKNLLKKPARGGIPAIENSTKVNVIVRIEFLEPAEIQLTRYFGKFFVTLVEYTKTENNNNVNIE
jgi:hypothetical protein